MCKQLRLAVETDIHQWLGKTFSVRQFIEPIKTDMRNCFSVFSNCSSSGNVLEYEVVQLGATIVHSLQLLNFVCTKTTFTLYIVGASDAEGSADWEAITDLLHSFTPIKPGGVKYILVGPEMWDNINYKNSDIYKDYYHNVADRIEEKPDLVVAFNCGFHEFEQEHNTWSKTISLLLSHAESPIVFTSYTKRECDEDLDCARNCGAHLEVLVPPQENLYRSFRPMRDWWDYSNPVYYSNNYMCIVRGSNKAV